MGKIVVTANVSLDGVVEDPDGQEGFRLGGWFGEYGGKDLQDWAELETAEALAAEALLLGRRSEAWFASRWQERTGAWADRLNSMPRYVVSSTLAEPIWRDATVLSGDVIGQVSSLKESTDGEIVVYGSYRLVASLLEHHLVDELRLVVFPVVLGDGGRLFPPGAGTFPLHLVSVRTLGDGLAALTYELTGPTAAAPLGG